MIDQEEFASANIDDYDFSGDENNDSQEEKYDDNYFNHSVKRDRESNNNDNLIASSWLDTVQETFLSLGAVFDFSGTQALSNLTR